MPFKAFEIASLIIFVVKLNLTLNYTFAPSNLFCVAGRMRKRSGLDFLTLGISICSLYFFRIHIFCSCF